MKTFTYVLMAILVSFGVMNTAMAEVKSPEKPALAFVVEKVNVNSANAMTIAASLKRVGIKKAEAIVAYRDANGRFTSKEQLLEVKGIGEATLRINADKIVF